MRALRHIVVTTVVSACALIPAAGLAGIASASETATENPPAGVSGPAANPAAATSTVTISGKGFGHGVGLAQDGDLALGRAGKKMPQILGYFYPGTRFGTIGDVTIRAAVVEVDGKKPIDVTLPAGGVVRVGTSGVSVAKGGVARLTHDGSGYHVKLLNPPKNARADTTSANGGTAYAVYSGGLEQVGGADYHGVLSVVADGKKLRAIDALPIETYLDGLGEVRDPSWPAASLQALVVAARSYAVHSLHPGALFDVWSDDRSQVYLGADAEYPALTSAVEKTRGLVLTYDGAVADTVYSASGGGVTATAAEGFGDDPTAAADEPYLTAGRYPTANPLPWSVTESLATIGAALHYPGTLSGLSVTAVGPSGRPTAVTLTGSSGAVVVPGLDLYHDLRLQSNLYSLSAVAAPVQSTATTGTTGTASGVATSGAATPHVVTRDAATSTSVPSPAPPSVAGAAPSGAATGAASASTASPSAAVGATTSSPAAVPAVNDLPAAAPTVPAVAVARSARLAGALPATRSSAGVRGVAIALWGLALLAFAAGLLHRRRTGGATAHG